MAALDLSHAKWFTSTRTHANGNCVEVAFLNAEWRASTRSQANGACVEVALMDDAVAVRDTKDRTGPTLTFPPTAWKTFLSTL